VRRPVLPILLLVAVVLIGVGTCNGGDEGDRSRVRAAERAGRRAVDETTTPPLRLEDALLTLGDLPDGYVGAPPEDDELPRTYYEVCGDPDVYGGLHPELAVSASFDDGAPATFVSHELRRYPPDVAALAMGRLEDALARCHLVTEHDRRGGVVSNRLSPVEPLAVPRPAVRFRLTRPEAGSDWRAEVVIVRRGDVLSTVAVYGTGAEPPPLTELAQVVERRLAALA
jgi:hypothetical protein